MAERITIASLSREVTTEAEAYAYFEGMRWGDSPICAHCDSANVALMRPENGVSRKTRTGASTQRRVWQCRDCRKQFSVITNTVMHGTKISVRTWLMVLFEMVSSKNGVAALEVSRKYGIAQRSAWFLCHRIREAMIAGDGSLFDGNVVADETYLGGKPANRHANHPNRESKRGRGTDKTAIVSLIDAQTGEIRSRVVTTVDGNTLGKMITENVAMATSTLHTDALTAYVAIGAKMAGHHAVDHSAGQYTTEKSHGTNAAENYFSQLKRSVDGTFHHVSEQHLPRYLAEFDYRYSTREMDDTARMRHLAKQVATRLTYKIVKVAA